ncbi:hypothetical protein QBC34DRAFT_189100 [Podospora aff. communis PSN243]|uniref:Zn(2)-C6 fungal-type domain-containing protein n=1 Tax=Podospora aff. communis PSN243 TaxID=3040156 RepID=A0AAV9GYN4_9PEZI|nr:hypothetical protein QBC34DRAFT_189100 [Podospora aff. communis PSN243]
MAEQLKRTFHGCLTCRKRKVRCHGGNPCQNCSRMNITCHSSFDTNLRIRVSTPNGQKVVDPKPAPKREPVAEAPKQQQQPQRPVPQHTYVGLGYSIRNDPYVASFQPQFSSFSFAQPTTTYAPEPSTVHLAPPSSLGGTIPSVDPGQFNGIWSPFDFGAIDPDLGRDFMPRVDVGVPAPLNLAPVFDSSSFLPPTPASQPYSISDSEGSTSSHSQAREAPKEWIPRRRKRTRKEETAMPATLGQLSASRSRELLVDESEPHSHLHGSTTQDDFINEQDAHWSFNRFVAEFVQKCSPLSPIRLAVLAWTAKHTSTESALVDPAVAAWYSQSSEQVEKLFNIPDPTLEIETFVPVTNVAEVIISTVFFLNRYDMLGGDLKAASSRLERMTRWLANTGSLSLSAFASKLLLWACYLQVRISIFSSDYLGFPGLLDVLTGRPDCHLILERSHNFYLDMFGGEYPQDRLAEDVERIPAALHLHNTFRLLTSILRYRALRHTQSLTAGDDLAAWEELAVVKRRVDDEMQRVGADFDLAVAINPSAYILKQGPIPGMSSSSYSSDLNSRARAPPTPPQGKLSRVSLHWLTAYAAFMTTKILWSRLIRLDVRTDETSTAAVESILQIALILRRSEGEKLHARELPSMLWPLPLFVAGIETVDEVWADWVRLFIKGVEGDGKGKGKIVELIGEIRRRQEEVGGRVVVTDVLAEKGQGTEIFVF